MLKRLFSLLALLAISLAASAQEPRLPVGFSAVLHAGGLSSPTAMAFAPDGRLFVTQQTGAVRVITAAGALLPTPFTTFTVDSTQERGLLGVAFDPDFASNHYVYFYYTSPGSGSTRNRVDRVTANGNTAVPGSAVRILQLPVLSAATNHNGGAIHFGLDGKLYVAVGDNALGSNSQSMTTRLGKMLRYNADGSIPSNNPFYGSASGANRAIWALGLRNPYTFAFQPGTGVMFINDVGGGSWEEINQGQAGGNYGWPNAEGAEGGPTYLLPVYAYNHSGGNCAITGGSFYNPAAPVYPASYIGDYFFADFCANEVRVLDVGTATPTVFDADPPANNIVDMHVGADGKLYTLARNPGAVYRYEFAADPVEGELIRNGGFETDSNGDQVPNAWTRSGTDVRRICNTNAIQGACSVRLRSGSGGGKLVQKIPVAGLVDGTTLTFSVMASGTKVGAGAVVRLVINTAEGRTNYNIPVPTGTFAAQTLALPPIALNATPVSMTARIIYPAGKPGRLIVDAVSLAADAP